MLDLTGGAMPNQGTQGIVGDLSTPVILYLFPPKRRRMSLQAHRPLLLNITDSLQNEIHAKTINAKRSGAVGGLANSIMGSADIYKAAALGFQPDAVMDLNPVSNDTWQFVMIWNNHPLVGMDGRISEFTGLTRHRVLCYGYCIDEPINRATMAMGQPTVNPYCQLVVTHKTVTQTMNTYGGNGSQVQKFVTRVDDHVIPCQTIPLLMGAAPAMHFIDPRSTSAGVIDAGNGQSIAFPSGNLNSLANFATAQTRESTLVQPLHNLMYTVRGAVSSIRDTFSMNANSAYHSDGMIPDLGGAMAPTFSELLQKNLSSPKHSLGMLGLEENSITTMDMIVKRFQPEIVPIIAPESTMMGAIDQTEQSQKVIFSDLIATSAPSIMANAGLSTLTFRYETFYETPMLGREDTLEVLHVESLTNFDARTLAQRVDSVIMELKKSVFATMIGGRGDFNLQADLNCIGMSHIGLHFKCDSLISDALFEKPTSLDGLLTPLFGDATSLAHNTTEMSKIIGAMSPDYSRDDELMAGYTGHNVPGTLPVQQSGVMNLNGGQQTNMGQVFGTGQPQAPQQPMPQQQSGIIRL